MRCSLAILLCLLASAPLTAQKQQREPLTETQIDKIAEAGINPDARVALYTQYLNEHADAIKSLTKRAKTGARSNRLSDALQDFSALEDELGDNLDTFAGRKADIRISLKALTEATTRWQDILQALATEPGFDAARTEAIESSNDLAGQATQMLQEQTAYFKLHPDEKGQDRWEPK